MLRAAASWQALPAHLVEEAVGLGVEAAGVQGEDAVGAAGEVSVLDQRDVLSAAEGDGDVGAEGGQGLKGKKGRARRSARRGAL